MRILVVDDHALFRDGLISLLVASGLEVIGQVGDGSEVLDAIQRLQPDVVLMDISMPGMDGLEALRLLRQEAPDVRVVMLTVSDEDADLFTAIQAGAQGYLLKSMDSAGFISSLKALDRGELAISRSAASRLIEGLVGLAKKQGGATRDMLTPRELELLDLVASGLSNKAVAVQLSVSENTVKYHMRQILQKLNVQNRTEAVITAMQLGLIETRGSHS